MTSSKHFPLCPVTRTALIIGSRWTAQIVDQLLGRPAMRFQDLQDGVPGITPAVLSNRLKMLEDAGLVEREVYASHPPRSEYRLTKKGREMKGVIGAMRDWGARHG